MILNKWAPLRVLVSAVSVLCVMASLEAQELPHSCARPDQIAIAHLHLDLKVDFESQKLAGSATMKLDRRTAASKLYLDTNGLKIFKVQSQPDGKELKWSLGEHEPNLGSSLSVELVDGVDEVTVYYESQPGAEAVQWLTPEQTTDKKYPFLFTQSQAILARTWVPCQDTPAVRMTYSAKIQVPPELLAVMSASNPQRKNKTGVYEFEMKQPIPAYLLALAVGDLKFLELGPRSGVYAEPSVLKKAVWELADTEKMISAAEALYGEYRWDRYDVIFLPSSFPFGGMENPRLTFATPTILAGDRSLVALIAHELAHSWSGNLVTNATWDDFWLNEGFTVYFEQRIMEAIYGREYSEMLAKLSLDGLLAEIKELEARDTWLKLDLRGRNPDDGMTSIAYDKGYFFLRMLEEKVGREKFDQFLKSYFKKFAFKSMTTEGFLSYLQENLDKKIDFNAWVYSPGLPADVPVVKTEALERVEQAAQNFLNGDDISVLAVDFETDQWTTHHWNHFLRSFKNDLSPAQMKSLDDQFRFTQSGNSEITHDWMVLVIGSGYQTGFPRLEEFLTEQGRRKFLQPLYEKMATTPEGLERANRIYAKARPGYHAVSRQTIDKILNYKPTEN
ncbi:MAG: M1 family metallopeptidase [Mariniblastus sp.]|nr:M1 family metallopeptidase [Mariniblastus sp.]MDG2180595.1 M1 family metallopeptidase [Mariniblastus sp.]